MGMLRALCHSTASKTNRFPGSPNRVANDQAVYSDTFLRSQGNRTPTGHSEARVYGAYLTETPHFLILKIL
jgi:hypothetical protein